MYPHKSYTAPSCPCKTRRSLRNVKLFLQDLGVGHRAAAPSQDRAVSLPSLGACMCTPRNNLPVVPSPWAASNSDWLLPASSFPSCMHIVIITWAVSAAIPSWVSGFLLLSQICKVSGAFSTHMAWAMLTFGLAVPCWCVPFTLLHDSVRLETPPALTLFTSPTNPGAALSNFFH